MMMMATVNLETIYGCAKQRFYLQTTRLAGQASFLNVKFGYEWYKTLDLNQYFANKLMPCFQQGEAPWNKYRLTPNA